MSVRSRSSQVIHGSLLLGLYSDDGELAMVVEVRYDHLEGRRFRHTAQFLRWRPDRHPRSCTYDQLEETVSFDLADVLTTTTT